MRYTVVYEATPRNYAAYVPDLPGCVATGRTRRAVQQAIRAAIRLHLDALRTDGRPVPPATAWTEVVEAP